MLIPDIRVSKARSYTLPVLLVSSSTKMSRLWLHVRRRNTSG